MDYGLSKSEVKEMEQKIFANKAHRFESETHGSEFDCLFEKNNLVEKSRDEQRENRQ